MKMMHTHMGTLQGVDHALALPDGSQQDSWKSLNGFYDKMCCPIFSHENFILENASSNSRLLKFGFALLAFPCQPYS